MAKRSATIGWGLAISWGLFACTPPDDPAVQLCRQVLARKLPEARIVEVATPSAGRHAALAFEVERGTGTPSAGHIECTTETSSNGGLRLLRAVIDGVALPEAEIAVVNAELLLADLRRSDPGRIVVGDDGRSGASP